MASLRVVLLASTMCTSIGISGFAAGARAATTAPVIQQTKLAGLYKLVLDIGPLEQMYSVAQAKAKHPKTGEIMLSGSMVMGGKNSMGMSGPMPNHHLELHVYDRASGKTIVDAHVSITVTTNAGKVLVKVPIAVMYGVTAGMNDLHYGNNVSLKNGSYHVATMVNTTAATFSVQLGGSAMGGMSSM